MPNSTTDHNTLAYQQCLKRDRLVIPKKKKKLNYFRGQAGWAKITSEVDKLTTMACHQAKK
jgi:hypothetical protein